MENNEKIKLFENIIERLKDVLGVSTIKEMYTSLGIKKSTYDTWKHRSEFPDKRIREFSKQLGINRLWLTTGEGEMFLTHAPELRAKNEQPSFMEEPHVTYGDTETVEVAYYPEVYASAGGGAMVYESLAHTKPIQLSKTFVEEFLGITSQKNMHILNVKGDSMEPTILDGELIFVLPLNGDGIADGNIYVMMYKDEIYVKRVRREAFTQTYKLSSDNPAVGDISLTKEQSEDCHIIGEVVGQMRSKSLMK